MSTTKTNPCKLLNIKKINSDNFLGIWEEETKKIYLKGC